jgi:uncharacterized protein RhaS with RHS repeats
MQARYYDPVIGRFYANDPIGALRHLDDGNIQGFSRYAYANNNPYKYVDPDGNAGKLAVSVAKTSYKLYKRYEKTGKLEKKDLYDIGGQELVDAGGDLYTIFGDPSATVVDKVKATVDLVTGLETNSKGADVAGKALSSVTQKLSSNSSVQELLKGTGQLAALARNPNLKGVDTASLSNMTLKEVKSTLTKAQFKTFMKHFEGRDLRHGN